MRRAFRQTIGIRVEQQDALRLLRERHGAKVGAGSPAAALEVADGPRPHDDHRGVMGDHQSAGLIPGQLGVGRVDIGPQGVQPLQGRLEGRIGSNVHLALVKLHIVLSAADLQQEAIQHEGGFPLFLGAQRQRRHLRPRSFDRLGGGQQLIECCGWPEPQLIEELLVIVQDVLNVHVQRDHVGVAADGYRVRQRFGDGVGIFQLRVEAIKRLQVATVHVRLQFGAPEGLPGVRRNPGRQPRLQDDAVADAATTGHRILHELNVRVLRL